MPEILAAPYVMPPTQAELAYESSNTTVKIFQKIQVLSSI